MNGYHLFLLYDYVLIIGIAFFSTYFLLPSVIKLARKNHFYDFVNQRKIHQGFIPRLGGVAILIGVIVAQIYALIEVNNLNMTNEYFVLMSLVLLIFVIGLLDDLFVVRASIKFIIEICIACLLVFYTDVKFESFYGALGIYHLPEWFSSLFSICYITLIINAFNLIDGLDGLVSYYAIIILLIFSGVFIYYGKEVEAIISVTILSSLIAFLTYNKHPAKIFMGDGGALTLGLLIAYLSIKVVVISGDKTLSIKPIMAMALLAFPIVDTLRVFTVRILAGISPFKPDQNHLHHKLLQLVKSHNKVCLIVFIFTLLMGSIGFVLRKYPNISFFTMIILMLIFSQLPSYLVKLQKQKQAFKTE